MKNLKIHIAILAVALLFTACIKDTPGPGSSGVAVPPKVLYRFTASGNTLYSANQKGLTLYNIANASSPTETKVISAAFTSVGSSNFTAFQNYLYMGQYNGLVIYDTTPAQAQSKGTFNGYNGCGPIVTNGTCVFLSDRTDSPCSTYGSTTGKLQVVDVSNPAAVSSKTYTMPTLYGVAVDGNNLFVCDGSIKFYDASNPANLVLKQTIALNATEVTAQNGKLAAVTATGITQYDYSSGTAVQISSIKLK